MVALCVGREASAQKRVLYVNSYHQGYPWSDGEENEAARVFKDAGIELRILRLDTKRHPEETFLKAAGVKLAAEIKEDKPDIVIAADDNAVRLMAASQKDTVLPWIFCGVNWDSKRYGLPFKNTTGIVEVSLVVRVLETLKPFAKGTRIGFLTADSETERTEGGYYKKRLGLHLDREKYVTTLAAWKQEFQRMQSDVDILYVGNYAGIKDWNDGEAASFAAQYGKIPSGTAYDFMMPVAMLGMIKLPEEQGRWAAKQALAVLNGTAPNQIVVSENTDAKVYVNTTLSEKAGIVFDPRLMHRATLVK